MDHEIYTPPLPNLQDVHRSSGGYHGELDRPPRPVSENELDNMESETRRIAAHDFSAGDFDWVPVPRQRHNADGWTVNRQQAFIRLLADTGSVERSAFQVGMTPQSCYRLRRQPGAEGFAQAWEAAVESATARLVNVAGGARGPWHAQTLCTAEAKPPEPASQAAFRV